VGQGRREAAGGPRRVGATSAPCRAWSAGPFLHISGLESTYTGRERSTSVFLVCRRIASTAGFNFRQRLGDLAVPSRVILRHKKIGVLPPQRTDLLISGDEVLVTFETQPKDLRGRGPWSLRLADHSRASFLGVSTPQHPELYCRALNLHRREGEVLTVPAQTLALCIA
jgi:hypothetical protein